MFFIFFDFTYTESTPYRVWLDLDNSLAQSKIQKYFISKIITRINSKFLYEIPTFSLDNL